MRFRFDKIDWKSLSENRRLKLNIGLAVALIIFFVFIVDIVFSVYRFRGLIEERPEQEKQIISKPAAKAKAKAKAPEKELVKVAIILDDAGGKIPDYSAICSIKQPLTISILPELGTSQRIAKQLADAGFEIMLHVPMEARNNHYTRYDGGMILCSFSAEQIKNTIRKDLSSVKYAVGFNNHMGSKATESERVMKDIFDSIKGQGLYFIDSKTTDRSVALKAARSRSIPSAENNIFLDSGTNEAYIAGSFKRLISMARTKGSAIGIGHATRSATISVLKKLMPEYEKNGITFVYASELVR